MWESQHPEGYEALLAADREARRLTLAPHAAPDAEPMGGALRGAEPRDERADRPLPRVRLSERDA